MTPESGDRGPNLRHRCQGCQGCSDSSTDRGDNVDPEEIQCALETRDEEMAGWFTNSWRRVSPRWRWTLLATIPGTAQPTPPPQPTSTDAGRSASLHLPHGEENREENGETENHPGGTLT